MLLWDVNNFLIAVYSLELLMTGRARKFLREKDRMSLKNYRQWFSVPLGNKFSI